MKVRSLMAFAIALSVGQCSAADFISVGFWNIEHLGARTPGQQPIALAEYIAQSGVDVLALSEIYDTDNDDTKKTSEELDTTFGILNEETADQQWEYLLLPNKNANDKSQLCAIAWNKKQVERAADPLKIAVADDTNDDFNTWDRTPHAIKFSAGQGRTDFVVIPVHMKSNVKPTNPQLLAKYGGSGAKFGAAQRAVEAKTLVDALPAVSQHFGGEQDIVIIGDTNILDKDEKAAEHFGAIAYRDLNEMDAPTFVTGDAPFDRIFLPAQEEFTFARQRILKDTSPIEHEEYLSDHYLILTTFRDRADDDQ